MTLGHLLRSLGAALVLFGALCAPASAAPAVVVAFLDGPGAQERLAAREDLALGYLGATQGRYSREQALLDISAGNRVSQSGYEPREVPRVRVRGGAVTGWGAVVRRARTAPTDIVPGALGTAVPGGAAFAGRGDPLEALVAADRRGRLRRGAAAALTVTVVDDAGLDRLLRARPPDRLVLVFARPPRTDDGQMLPMGVAGAGSGLLTSRTTRRRGLVAGTDVAATALAWLRAPVPGHVRGRPITAEGERDVAWLRAMEARLADVDARRFPAVLWIVITLAALAAALVATGRRRAAARSVALAGLWIPCMTLVTAALSPSRPVEYALMGLGCAALGALTDRLVRWPRAPAVPAGVTALVFTADLALGSELIVRSMLGPNPRFGSRFYGIGNELEAALPVVVLVGLAAAAGAAPRSRRLAAAVAVAMLAFGVILGAGRLGADVGAVIFIGAAGAVAVLGLLPGRIGRRAVLAAVAAPVLALAALAALDALTGGDAHFSSTILGADSAGEVAETLGRRYELAFGALTRGLMPLVTAAAAILAAVAVRRRATLYAPVRDFPAWPAALAGGLAGSVVGALANDSGPILLIIGVVVLAFATLYVRGRPVSRACSTPSPAASAPPASATRPATTRASRWRAGSGA